MNSKNAYAFGFALIGAGVGGYLGAGTDNILVYVGMGLCFGCFIGYFFAGLKGAKSVLLQQDFQKLGDLRGMRTLMIFLNGKISKQSYFLLLK